MCQHTLVNEQSVYARHVIALDRQTPQLFYIPTEVENCYCQQSINAIKCMTLHDLCQNDAFHICWHSWS